MMEQGKEITVITAIDTDSPNYSGDNVRPGDEIVKVSNKIVAGDYNAAMAALAEAKKGKSRTAACQVVRRNPPLQLDGKKAPSAAAPATPRKRHSCHARRERGPLHPLTLLLRNNNRRHDHRSCSRLHLELEVQNGR